MPVKPSEPEERHFQKENERLLANMRGEVLADKETRERWARIAAAVGSQDLSIGHRLEDLGFTEETAGVLFLCPLVEVAWADGKVGYEEAVKLVDELRKRGMRASGPAYEFLSKLTLERPSQDFFDGCNLVIRELLNQLPEEERQSKATSLAELCAQVAEASRGFFGFGPKVSKEEREAIAEIVQELGLEASPKTAEILSRL